MTLVDRLLDLRTPEPIPRDEWEWLAAHAALEHLEPGADVAPAGGRIASTPSTTR